VRVCVIICLQFLIFTCVCSLLFKSYLSFFFKFIYRLSIFFKFTHLCIFCHFIIITILLNYFHYPLTADGDRIRKSKVFVPNIKKKNIARSACSSRDVHPDRRVSVQTIRTLQLLFISFFLSFYLSYFLCHFAVFNRLSIPFFAHSLSAKHLLVSANSFSLPFPFPYTFLSLPLSFFFSFLPLALIIPISLFYPSLLLFILSPRSFFPLSFSFLVDGLINFHDTLSSIIESGETPSWNNSPGDNTSMKTVFIDLKRLLHYLHTLIRHFYYTLFLQLTLCITISR
jgi:hypothetical protein